MESPDPLCSTITLHKQKIQTPNSNNNILQSNPPFRYTSAVEIVKEIVRILSFNPSTFIAIVALLIYPVSAVHLSNILLNQSILNRMIVKRITELLLFVSNSSGFSSTPFMNQSCRRFAEITVSSMVSFPFQSTLFFISKAAIVHSVESTYSRKKFVPFKLYPVIKTIWRRILSTYLLTSGLILGCVTLFFVVLICVIRLLYAIGFSPNSIAYISGTIGLLFFIFLAYTVVICDLSLVISMWEDVSALHAMAKARVLITCQSGFGLVVFLGSTIGMVMVKGLVEYWVRSLSYETECWKILECPVLGVVYSLLVLVDFKMSTVFYFGCSLVDGVV